MGRIKINVLSAIKMEHIECALVVWNEIIVILRILVHILYVYEF